MQTLNCFKSLILQETLKTQINIRRNSAHFRKSHVCANKLDVQETDFSSMEAEIISLDAGLRMDGIPALTLRDLVIEVFHSEPNRIDGPKREPWRNPSAVVKPNMHKPIPIKHTNVIPTNIGRILSNTTTSSDEYIFLFYYDKFLHRIESDCT